jgi:hypothetical protein
MTDDIVTRLHRHRCVTGIRTVIDDAADEIERLRRNTGCARDQRSTQFCAEALDAQRDVETAKDELRQRVETLTAERDEARQRLCKVVGDNRDMWGEDVAKEYGWDCFKEPVHAT